MADRPDADHPGQPASYSPPPQRRPAWIARGSAGAAIANPEQGARAGWPAASQDQGGRAGSRELPSQDGTTGAQETRPGRSHGLTWSGVMVALVAAVAASLGTYALLLAGGQLDRQVVVPQAPAQAAGAGRLDDPDVVRVVEESAITAAVDRVSPAVVTIMPRGMSGGFTYTEGVGSGVIFDADGWVVTNRHVVCNADTLSVQLADGQRFEGQVQGLDTLTDLAIVKIDGTGLPAADIGNSGTLRVGPEGHRHRQPAGYLHQLGHDGRGERHRSPHRRGGHLQRHRRAGVPARPHPDGRRHQPGQQRWGARGRGRHAHRHQHGHRG